MLLLGGLVAAATILGGVYVFCFWRYRRSYDRLSESVPGSTEKLVTSTEVSIYDSREGGGLLDNEDNERSRVDAAAERKEKAAVGKADQLQVAQGKDVAESTSESTESSEVGDQESKPLLAGSGPKEAAKNGIAGKLNAAAQLTVPTGEDVHVPTKEKGTGDFAETLVERTEKPEIKSLDISTVSEDAVTTQLLPAETTEQQKVRGKVDDAEPAEVSEIAERQKLDPEPLIDLTSTSGDGVTDTLPFPTQTGEVRVENKSGPVEGSFQVESPPSVKTSTTPALTATEETAASKESIADKLNALFQPKPLQKETEDPSEHTQTFPPMTRSPLPQVAPKPAPRKTRPSDSSPRPASSASPGGAPPVAAKPVGQARKPAFSPSAVPVLPMAFGKGGFVPPALRRKAEVSNGGTGEEGLTGGRLPMGAMFNGRAFGTRPRSEGGTEEPTSFDEVGIWREEGQGREREGGR